MHTSIYCYLSPLHLRTLKDNIDANNVYLSASETINEMASVIRGQ